MDAARNFQASQSREQVGVRGVRLRRRLLRRIMILLLLLLLLLLLVVHLLLTLPVETGQTAETL